ncbi:MAG: acyl carrier protein phosphodiesterase [Natronospirillum sp.]|uniref:acyl carrier protein phosphodiesterase n=1 Tax=Natronospirillum sp. TaxID=2812955 RepID=UPI0025DBE53A|nr:acyl carrier protein phosphodiesterase [Natronospirillum sp.]MCH8550950.1 acyl carrier protein phosphodiesterase [Natronospirillum sp.]
MGQLLPDCMPPKQLPEGVSDELRHHVDLHLTIDRLTDSHPAVQALRRSLPPPYRRFGGVILDVFFDHCLARNWSQWSAQPLPEFAEGVYTALAAYNGPENERLKMLRTALVQRRWLPGYATREGMARALESLDRRSRFRTPLAEAPVLLDSHGHQVDQVFADLFPALRAAVNSQTRGTY